ncbi:MAG: nucleobase:cation symporter-2 family protein [Elusimicrobiota bacterium]
MSVHAKDLEYRIGDRPPLARAVLLALQHMMAAFGGIVAVPLIIGSTAQGGVLASETPYLISCSLFCAGLATLIQTRRIWRVGSGLPIVMGTSFTFVGPGLQAANAGGLAAYFGCTLVGSVVEGAFAFLVPRLRRVFPPIVTGTVVCLIGLSLMPVALLWIGGGAASKLADPPAYGAPQNLLLGGSVLALIVLLSRFGRGILSTGAVFFGMACGYAAAALMGAVDFSPLREGAWLTIPMPLRYGIALDWAVLLPFVIAYVVTTIETIGDTIAVMDVSGTEFDEGRLQGSVLADAVGSAVAGVFNAGPNTSFSQNVGIIPLTRVASVYVVVLTGILLIVSGLLPKLSVLISLMPEPVLGGAGVAMFGMIAASGIRIVSREELGSRELMVLAVSLGVGMVSAIGSQDYVDLFGRLPESTRIFFSSGICTGALTAVALNLLLRPAGRA